MTFFARLTAPLLFCLATLFLSGPLMAQDAYFETGALNSGLGDAPPFLDRETPMGAMESFLFHTNQEEYAAAAHLLDLSGLPSDEQAEKGPNLARELAILIDRKVMVHWDRLADRPDGWLEGSTESDATGRERRSILIDVLGMDGHNVPLRLNRVKPENGDPVWLISRQTVANIPNLFGLYGPTEIEKSLPDWARNKAVFGMYVWEVIFVPLLLACAIVLGWFTFKGVGRLGRYANTRLGHSVTRALRWPATIIVTVALVGFATRRVLVVSGVIDSFISPAVLFGYIAGATLAVVLVIDELLDRIGRQRPAELADPDNAHMRNIATTISGARKFVIVIAVLIAGGMLLTSANAFRSLGVSLLASAGALTIVLGFAAREVLGNILAAVQIALNRSARIGDQLIFDGRYCTVESINFTYVQLLIWNGNRFIVPVSRFIKDAFENWSIEDVKMIRPICLTLAQTADIDKMRDYFLNMIENEDGDNTGPVDCANVHVIDQDVFGKKVRFELPTPNPATGWEMECLMRERLLAEALRLQNGGAQPFLPSSQIRDMPDN